MLANCLAYGLDMLQYGLTCHNEIQIDCTCKNTDKLDMLKNRQTEHAKLQTRHAEVCTEACNKKRLDMSR